MRYRLVLLSCFLCPYYWVSSEEVDEQSDTELVSQLRNDANLDLSADEEYEDLRAELLAYHTALASIATRRSLRNTPCWAAGGICVHYRLCHGARFLTEIPGCKDQHNVCCFAWNRFRVRDMRDHGIKSPGLPWALHTDFGGRGWVDQDSASDNEKTGQHKKREKTLKKEIIKDIESNADGDGDEKESLKNLIIVASDNEKTGQNKKRERTLKKKIIKDISNEDDDGDENESLKNLIIVASSKE